MTTPENTFRATAANLADAATTDKEMSLLIDWHRNQMMVHENAIAILRKAQMHTRFVIDAMHEETTDLKTKIEQGQSQ